MSKLIPGNILQIGPYKYEIGAIQGNLVALMWSNGYGVNQTRWVDKNKLLEILIKAA